MRTDEYEVLRARIVVLLATLFKHARKALETVFSTRPQYNDMAALAMDWREHLDENNGVMRKQVYKAAVDVRPSATFHVLVLILVMTIRRLFPYPASIGKWT